MPRRRHEDIRDGLCTHAPLLAHATRLERRACHLPALRAGEPFTTIWLRGAGLCDYDNYNSHDKHSAPRSPLWSLGGYEISLFESWFAPLGIRGAEMIDYWCQGFRNFSCAERVSLRREARMTGPYAQVGVAKVLGVRVDACAVWY